MVFATLGSPDNLPQNKRVESIKVARLDPGSTPGGSTGMTIKKGTLEGAVFYVSVIFFYLLASNACAKSAMRSSMSSIPTATRIRLS